MCPSHLCTPSPFKVPIALLHPLPIQCATRTCAPPPHSVRHPHLCTPSPFKVPIALVHPLPIQCGTHTCAPPPYSVRPTHIITYQCLLSSIIICCAINKGQIIFGNISLNCLFDLVHSDISYYHQISDKYGQHRGNANW
jgi:hypothetical protein